MQHVVTVLGVALCLVGAACSDNGQSNGQAGQGQLPGVNTAATSGDVPCGVAEVLKAHCAKCHGATPSGGAPLSLVRASEFQVQRGAATAGQVVLLRVRDLVRPMPQPPAARLNDQEIAVLEQWINAGAAADPAGCAVQSPAVPASTGGMGAGGMGTGGMGTGGMGAGGMGAGGMGAGGMGTGGATGPTLGWSMFGRDLKNSRSNPDESTLSPSNVSGLRQLWKHDGAGTTSTPAVVDGIVYLPSWDGSVRALRADDGSQVWMTMLPDLIDSSPAVTATKVYVSDDAGSVHALDRITGTKLWSKRVEAHAEAHLWSSPVVIEEADLLVVGVASAEEDSAVPNPRTFRGSVVGLSASSGALKWQFYTTDNDASSGPGIAVWGTPSVDTTRKTLYVGTGNNYAAPAGKYADSMLAINYETGKLVWSTQFTANDVFIVGPGATGPDSDIGSTANLFSANGKDLVGIGVKNGIYYALERDAGTLAWMTMITPGSVLGGVISAGAYADSSVFVASNRYQQGTTRTVALNAETGAVRWEHSAPMITYGGIAHANGVAYLATTSGTIFALDAASGRELWSDSLPDSIAGSPTVAGGMLFVPWGYQWTLRHGNAAVGGLVVYGL